MAVQYSIQKMVSNGTLSTIALGIQYLQRNDIYIRIAGEETPQIGAHSGYTWSFINNTTLKILPVVPNGVEVVVYRRTDVDAMYNIYSQNAQFDEATIDENNQQLLYIAQEYLEQGLPGTGVDTIEYVRDDGSFTYYRMRRTDGSYSEEFTVPSASNSTKVLTRESIRRSYAEAGFNLVDGSFEVGGTLVNTNDVLLQERTGKAFSGPAGAVAAGTDPASGGFVDASVALLRTQVNQSLYSFLAAGDGVSDDYPETQNAASSTRSIDCGDGTFLLSQQVVMSVPKKFSGNGATTKFKAAAGFAGPIFRVSPAAGSDHKGWTISDFVVESLGAATNVFLLDIATAGKYLSKLKLSGVVSTAQVSNHFVELLNPSNIDGLFTSVFCDNWSVGGYYLDNVGDSVVLERNTTTGDDVGYYVNQLGTAANIIIRDGNCTCSAGALNQVKGANLIFEGMQVECPAAFTGVNNAAVSVARPSGGSIYNTKLLNNNINTQGNPLYCIYLNNAVQTVIDGNELYCDVAAGAHIYIDAGGRDTIIGNNKYYNKSTGAETGPIIIDNGVGTVGIWKDATISLVGWTSQGTSNEHPLGFFKGRDGEVQLRGRLAGAATTAGVTLFMLPVGFRPKTKGYIVSVRGVVSGSPAFVDLHVTPSGAVLVLTAGATSTYLSGAVFSTR